MSKIREAESTIRQMQDLLLQLKKKADDYRHLLHRIHLANPEIEVSDGKTDLNDSIDFSIEWEKGETTGSGWKAVSPRFRVSDFSTIDFLDSDWQHIEKSYKELFYG